MQAIRGLGLFMIISIALGACFTPPEYPNEPQIEFESIQYKEVGTGMDSNPDSLILTLSFKDGDGDLGLSADELDCASDDVCYNNKRYTLFRAENGDLGLLSTGQTCSGTTVCYANRFHILKREANVAKYITYKDRRTNPDYASLPAFSKPYNCINWNVIREENVVVDTVYFELNPDYSNIEVDFLVKNASGGFDEFDWMKEFNYPNCGISFDGRFPILFKDRTGSPLEGTIRYGLGSVGFKILFSTKTLKLRVQIKDRALNKSNVIETNEFTLN